MTMLSTTPPMSTITVLSADTVAVSKPWPGWTSTGLPPSTVTVTAAAVAGGQTSIDPKVIEPWLGPNVLKHNMINKAVPGDEHRFVS